MSTTGNLTGQLRRIGIPASQDIQELIAIELALKEMTAKLAPIAQAIKYIRDVVTRKLDGVER
ncbi:MAG: hypothetical protein ACRD41_04215 [Candidatus Acidiferrales bacterium]